jgi:hypothetical protein
LQSREDVSPDVGRPWQEYDLDGNDGDGSLANALPLLSSSPAPVPCEVRPLHGPSPSSIAISPALAFIRDLVDDSDEPSSDAAVTDVIPSPVPVMSCPVPPAPGQAVHDSVSDAAGIILVSDVLACDVPSIDSVPSAVVPLPMSVWLAFTPPAPLPAQAANVLPPAALDNSHNLPSPGSVPNPPLRVSKRQSACLVGRYVKFTFTDDSGNLRRYVSRVVGRTAHGYWIVVFLSDGSLKVLNMPECSAEGTDRSTWVLLKSSAETAAINLDRQLNEVDYLKRIGKGEIIIMSKRDKVTQGLCEFRLVVLGTHAHSSAEIPIPPGHILVQEEGEDKSFVSVHRCNPGPYQTKFTSFLPFQAIPAVIKTPGKAAIDVQDNSDDSDLEDSLPDRLQPEECGSDCISLSDSEHYVSVEDTGDDSSDSDSDFASPIKGRRGKSSSLATTVRKPKVAGKRVFDPPTTGEDSLSAEYPLRARLSNAAEDPADPIGPFTQSQTQVVSYLDESPPPAKGVSKQAKCAKRGPKLAKAAEGSAKLSMDTPKPRKKRAVRLSKAKKGGKKSACWASLDEDFVSPSGAGARFVEAPGLSCVVLPLT